MVDDRGEATLEQITAALKAIAELEEVGTPKAFQKEFRSLRLSLTAMTQEKLSAYAGPVVLQILYQMLPVAVAAAVMSYSQTGGKGGSPARNDVNRDVESVKIKIRKNPKYSTPEFKCIGDFEKCKSFYGGNTSVCSLAFIVCVSKFLIPFAARGKANKSEE